MAAIIQMTVPQSKEVNKKQKTNLPWIGWLRAAFVDWVTLYVLLVSIHQECHIIWRQTLHINKYSMTVDRTETDRTMNGVIWITFDATLALDSKPIRNSFTFVLTYLQKTDQLWLYTNLFLIYLASTIQNVQC